MAGGKFERNDKNKKLPLVFKFKIGLMQVINSCGKFSFQTNA